MEMPDLGRLNELCNFLRGLDAFWTVFGDTQSATAVDFWDEWWVIVQMGMPHRGRLNVLCNLLHKPAGLLFGEMLQAVSEFHVGDVQYHQGECSTLSFPRQVPLPPPLAEVKQKFKSNSMWWGNWYHQGLCSTLSLPPIASPSDSNEAKKQSMLELHVQSHPGESSVLSIAGKPSQRQEVRVIHIWFQCGGPSVSSQGGKMRQS